MGCRRAPRIRPGSGVMPRSRGHLTLYAVLVLAAAAATIFGLNEVYGFLNSSSSAAGSQRTATVARGTVQSSVSASGNVGVATSAAANFATSGTLQAVDVKVGDHVKVGEVLAKIDPRSAQDALQSAEANLAEARSTLATAESGLTVAQKAADAVSVEQAQETITTDEQQLAADETTLATAQQQYATDARLGFPAAGASSSASAGNASSSTGSSSTSGASTGATASTNGTSSNGTSSNGTSSNGTSSNGATSNGATSNGATSNSTSSNGTTSNGATSNGTTSNGATSNGTSSNSTSSNGATSNSTTSNGATSNGATSNGATSNGATSNSTSVNGVAQNGTSSNGTSSNGTSSNGTSSNGTSAAGTSSTGTSSTGTSSTGTSSTGTSTTGTSTTGTSTTGASTPGTSTTAAPGGGVQNGVAVFERAEVAPVVVTGSASAVGSTSATLNGTVSPEGLDTTYSFAYGTSATNLSSTTHMVDAGSGSVPVPVSVPVSGLEPDQSYYVELVATNTSGTTDGSLAIFTTTAPAQTTTMMTTTTAPVTTPVVTTGQASSVSATSATLAGTVQTEGLATSYYFAYGSSPTSLGTDTATVDIGSGSGSVPASATVSGLSPDTQYYFQLVATNSSGTTDGSTQLFTTSTLAFATTGQASSVTATGATLAGSVSPGGIDTSYYFEYGTSPSTLTSVTATTDAGAGSASVPVSATVSKLLPDQGYYFELVATNASGTAYGAPGLFTTGTLTLAETGQSASVGATTATLEGTVSPGGEATSYYFEYGASATALESKTATFSAGAGTASVPVSVAVKGLKPQQVYYFALVASNASGTTVGGPEFFTTAASTAATTGSASSIDATGATLGGSVSPAGLATRYWFEYGSSATALNVRTATFSAGAGTASIPVSVAVKGLKPEQTYYFALVASSAAGTTVGGPEFFTTAASTAATTGSASAIGSTTATLGGSVSPGGLATSYWFEYGTSASSLGSRTPRLAAGAGTESLPVSESVSGLEVDRTYMFRLVVSNASGTTDGALELFTTADASVSATTGQASAVGSTTATLSGSVDPGGLDTSDRFEYGTSAAAFASATPRFNVGSGTGSVSVTATLEGLRPDTTYRFRLVATNSTGASEGVEQTFTTVASAKPTVVTGSASGALTESLTLSGSVNPNGSDAKYWFEYGTTTAYGRKTALLDAGSGTDAVQASATLTGLKPDTSYLFRLMARSAFGTSAGLSEVASTAATSRTGDEQAITTDEQTLQHQEATVETAKESLAETEATIASSETPSAATIAQDTAAVSQDETTVATDRQTLAETTLTSPISGVVTAVNGSIGEAVSGTGSTISTGASTASSSSSASTTLGGSASSSSGSSSSSGLVTIDSLGQLEIVSGFAEADATKIAVGQPATITFPALPETEVAGKVVAVSNTSTVVSNVVTYNETIALVNPPADVKDGMTADVSVIDQTASNTLELPSAAITTTGTRSTVELLQNGKTTVTPIVTGLVGNSSTQIVSGLSAGDVVVEPTVTITAASTAGTAATGLTGLGGGGGFGGGGFGGGGGGFGRGG